jgi:enoyl-CoA hydratase/carnithine racemase
MSAADTEPQPEVVYHRHGHVAVVRLNPPHRYNTVNEDVITALTEIWADIDRS